MALLIMAIFKVERAHEVGDNQFFFHNLKIMRFWRPSKCSKTTIKLTFTHKTQTLVVLGLLVCIKIPVDRLLYEYDNCLFPITLHLT